jgi:cholesterol transport system auxiliary component
MNLRPTRAWLGVAACSLLGACALLSKAEPLVPRYFTPEDGSSAAEPHAMLQASASARRLRLASVRGGSQLRERIMFRDSAHELGYYPDRRWTERPEAYLRRALARTLFEERGLLSVASGSLPTLEVELVAFEEVRAPEHKARVQVVITLEDERSGSEQATITIEQPVQSNARGDEAEAAVDALASALQRCVNQIADRVLAKLMAPTAQEPSLSTQ